MCSASSSAARSASRASIGREDGLVLGDGLLQASAQLERAGQVGSHLPHEHAVDLVELLVA